jgi:hypothetical protein
MIDIFIKISYHGDYGGDLGSTGMSSFGTHVEDESHLVNHLSKKINANVNRPARTAANRRREVAVAA